MRASATLTCFLCLTAAAALSPAQKRRGEPLPPQPGGTVQFRVYLPLQHTGELDALLKDLHDPQSPNYRHWLRPEQFQSRFAPDAATVTLASDELEKSGLHVIKRDAHGLQVEGSAEAVQHTFATTLSERANTAGPRFEATAPIQLPPALASLGARVIGLSPRIRQRTMSRRSVQPVTPENRYSPYGPYWFTDIKEAYNFPSYKSLNGKGVTIGILMEYDFQDSDMAKYFGHEKLAVPTIKREYIDGGAPFELGLSDEVSLDIQQSGGMAPGATIIDYNIPDLSDTSIIDALLQIVGENAADIVSMSFAGPEGLYTAAYNGGSDYSYLIRIEEELFAQGNAQGITFVSASGDEGGLPLEPISYFTTPPQAVPVIVGHYVRGAEYPASSPHVTGVGGTNLTTYYKPPSLDSKYESENAFGDWLQPDDPYGIGNLVSGGIWGSGGGQSIYFTKPNYQYLVNTNSSRRTVPDIAMQMGGCPGGTLTTCPDARSYVITAVGGQYYGLIGTSVSAPEFAGVLAILEEHLGGVRVGNANTYIYALAAGALFGLSPYHEGIPGNNGAFSVPEGKQGYNEIVGVGTPSVRDFIGAPYLPAAGTPKTPTNP